MRRSAAMVVCMFGVLPGCGPGTGVTGAADRTAGIEDCSVRILAGGRVRTGFREGDAVAGALGISADGSVVAVGSLDEVRATACPGADVIDLAGATAIPGLADAHGHVLSLGLSMGRVDLRAAASAVDAAERAARFAEDLPDGAWVLGRGWDQNPWADPSLPDRAALDERLGDHPALLTRVDGHAAWANSIALDAAGVDASTPDPEGGAIERRPDGRPTGVLLDNAIDLVESRVPEPSAAERREAIERALGRLASVGLTSVHDMGVDPADVAIFEALALEGRLPLRVVAYLDGTRPLPAGAGPVRAGLFEVVGTKLFADGALGSRGALLLDEYSDDPGNRGLEVATLDALGEAGRDAASRGLAVAIHAIGDAGIRNALDAVERLAAEGSVVGRPRIEHVQVLSAPDLPRLAALGAVASMQPVHATSDMPWAGERLGPERVRLAYAWRSVADSGAALAFGTDFPVEDPDPRATLRAATTRRSAGGEPPGGWHPEQRVTPREALEAMTAGAASACGAESSRGRLEPGMRADVTVLDRDPLETPPDEVERLRVVMTVVDGVVAYRASTGAGEP